jgi:hypothetical protein
MPCPLSVAACCLVSVVHAQIPATETWHSCLGVLIVGIADVRFTFLQLGPGIIAASIPSVRGPVI